MMKTSCKIKRHASEPGVLVNPTTESRLSIVKRVNEEFKRETSYNKRIRSELKDAADSYPNKYVDFLRGVGQTMQAQVKRMHQENKALRKQLLEQQERYEMIIMNLVNDLDWSHLVGLQPVKSCDCQTRDFFGGCVRCGKDIVECSCI